MYRALEVGAALATGDLADDHKMIYKQETFFISWQSLHLDEISKRFDLQEGRAERKLFLDIHENRATLALSACLIPFLHFIGLSVSTLFVKYRCKSVLKSNLVHPVYLLMQKHKVRRGRG